MQYMYSWELYVHVQYSQLKIRKTFITYVLMNINGVRVHSHSV